METRQEAPSGELGRLKLFVGAAPGVGKTYTMLREANALRNKGVEVVVGYVDTHERPDTEAQIKNLEIMPRLQVPFQGRSFEEVDLGAILARRPDVVVIDELAHTNVPGSRFAKRYLDVEFLLDAGIDVLTAVNIHHVEDLAEEAEEITGQKVREIIPNSFVKRASAIEVIDVTPETLRQRLRDGGIYEPDKVDQALQNFFRLDNLSALRELVLRSVADDVDERLQRSFERKKIPGPVGARETIMVCVNFLDRSEKLVTRAKRMADRMKAELIMVTVVQVPEEMMSARERDNLAALKSLSDRMEAEFVIEPRNDRPLGRTISEVAERENVTTIVIGQPRGSGLRALVKESPVPYLLKNLRYVDLRIVGWRETD